MLSTRVANSGDQIIIHDLNVFQLDEHCHTAMSVLFDLRNCLRGTVKIDGFSRNDNIRQIMDCIYVN